MRMADCFADWGGFEKFVAELNRTGDLVSVEHNAHPIGRSGLARQIDVLVTHRHPPFKIFKTIIDCKLWNSTVKRMHVDAMVTAMQDLGASRGAFFTTKGFQSGALEFARQSNVDLFKLRDLTNEEWGGRILKFRLQVYDRSMVSQHLRARGRMVTGRGAPKLNLQIGGNGVNPLWYLDGTPAESLEKNIDFATQERTKQIVSAIRDQMPADVTEHLQPAEAMLKFDPPRRWTNPSDHADHFIFYELTVPFIVRVRQSTFTVDRSANFPIALAVVDCITKQTYIASKRTGETIVKYDEMPDALQHDPPAEWVDIQVILTGWFPYPAEGAESTVDASAGVDAGACSDAAGAVDAGADTAASVDAVGINVEVDASAGVNALGEVDAGADSAASVGAASEDDDAVSEADTTANVDTAGKASAGVDAVDAGSDTTAGVDAEAYTTAGAGSALDASAVGVAGPPTPGASGVDPA